MERSQSCTHFTQVAAATTTTTATSKTLETITSTNTATNTTMQLRTLQQKSASGSSLNVKQIPNTSVANTYAPLLPLNAVNLRRKRKLLQRQQSHEYADDDMDFEYAADHEDDEDEEDVDLDGELTTHANEILLQPIVDNNNMIKLPQRTQLQPLLMKKNMQFQRRKPQSSNALLLNAMSSVNSMTQPLACSSLCGTPPPCNYYAEHQRKLKHENSFDSSSSAGIMSLGSPVTTHRYSLLKRDNSIHSDSSRYSSVDSLLEARKPDPEAILINLGFGPVGSEDVLSRIPKRFLKPSQVPGNDTEAFVRRLQLASSLADHSVLGYRGLTGNPDIPPSSIVAKIMHRFEVNERKKSLASIEHTIQ